MPNPFTRDQTLENAAFLRALRRTGNVREAAREIGRAYGTMQHRRRKHPAFAARWDAALVSATARLNDRGGARRPEAALRNRDLPSEVAVTGVNRVTSKLGDAGPGRPDAVSRTASLSGCGPLRTLGGEEVVVLRRDGTLQVRRAQPGKLTRACEQAFLSALSSTANVKLSAAAAGAAEAAFYRRKRRDPGFAREWRLALERGWEALNGALLSGTLPDAHEDDAWRHNDPPPIPPMTANQAIQLLHLHYKEARLWATRPDIFRRRKGETSDGWSARRADDYIAELARDAETSQLAQVARAGGLDRSRWAPPAPVLPALEQVTGWSRAKRHTRGEAGRETAPARPAGREANPFDVMGLAHDGPAVDSVGFAVPPPPDPANGRHHPDTALFGGWRLEDVPPERRAGVRGGMD